MIFIMNPKANVNDLTQSSESGVGSTSSNLQRTSKKEIGSQLLFTRKGFRGESSKIPWTYTYMCTISRILKTTKPVLKRLGGMLNLQKRTEEYLDSDREYKAGDDDDSDRG